MKQDWKKQKTQKQSYTQKGSYNLQKFVLRPRDGNLSGCYILYMYTHYTEQNQFCTKKDV